MNTIPDETRAAYRRLTAMLDECGYSISYDRLAEQRPDDHRCWSWAHWNKYAEGASRWVENQTRIAIRLDDYSLDFACEMYLPIRGLPKVRRAYHHVEVSIADLAEWGPHELRAVEEHFSEWATKVCGTSVHFAADGSSSANVA